MEFSGRWRLNRSYCVQPLHFANIGLVYTAKCNYVLTGTLRWSDMRDKRQKFVDLANRRVNAATKCLRLIGNLGNRSNYDYTEDDVRKITRALQRELDGLKVRFGESGPGSETAFKL